MIGSDFLKNGFQVFNVAELISDISLEGRSWVYEGGANNDYHLSTSDPFYSMQGSWLLSIHYAIASQFVEPTFSGYSIGKRRLWQGVNSDATDWHNDLNEGPNCFFLLYFSDLEKTQSGAVHFRNSTEQWKLYPTPGLLVAVNCLPEFFHKADQTPHERILASFYFNLDHGTYNQTN